jgi:uncharacterized protein YkwD
VSPSTKTRLRPEVDALDVRALPATGVTAYLSSGVLSIVGSIAPDQIIVTFRGHGPRATLSVDGGPQVRVSKVHAISIQGGGNDYIDIHDQGRFAIPALIRGGPGYDTILGGSGHDVIFGGSGGNIIWASANSVIEVGNGPSLINGVYHAPTLPVGTTPPATTPPVTTPPSTTPPRTTPPNTTPPNTTPPNTTPPNTSPTPAQIVAQIITLTNQDRQANGLSALTVSAKLMQAAQIHASDMATFEVMDHTLPQAADPTLQSRAAAVGYSFSLLGENIALNYTDAQSVETAWMNSPGHRANILYADFTEFGVAIAYDVLGEPYICVNFGRPA